MKKTSLTQNLIDLKATCADLGGRDELIAQATALLTALDSDPLVERETEKRYQGHQYKNLRYSRVSTYQERPEALLVPLELSDKAARLLMLLERIAIRQEIQLSHSQVAQLLRVSDCSARRALAELIDRGILIKTVPARGHEATIYKISSCFYKVGKTLASPEDEKKLPYQIKKKEPGSAPSAEELTAKERWKELESAITVCKSDFNGKTHVYIRLAF